MKTDIYYNSMGSQGSSRVYKNSMKSNSTKKQKRIKLIKKNLQKYMKLIIQNMELI